MPTKVVLKNTSLPSKVTLSPTSGGGTNGGTTGFVRTTRVSRGYMERDDNSHLDNGAFESSSSQIELVNQQNQQQQDFSSSSAELVIATPPRSNLTIQQQEQQAPRSVLNFRSSMLREQTVRNITNNNNNNNNNNNSTSSNPNEAATVTTIIPPAPAATVKIRLSKDDIRASPRLTGYLFTMIAAAVLLTSVVKFFNALNYSSAIIVEDKYVTTPAGSLILRWKLFGAIYVSAIGCFLSFCTVLVHFDTIILPAFWIYIFRDGSLAERNWIFFLIVYWAGAVHICTSTFSIGELQPNVFFTTWIAFGSIASTFDVWRDSAGLTAGLPVLNPTFEHTATSPTNNNNNNNRRTATNNTTNRLTESTVSSLSQTYEHPHGGMLMDAVTLSNSVRGLPPTTDPVVAPPPILDISASSFRRETTINWIWTLMFSLLFACSIADVYYNRNHLTFAFGIARRISAYKHHWIIILSTVWADVFVCIFSITLNESSFAITKETNLLPCFIRRSSGATYGCVFGWRQIEGIVICCAAGFKFWIIISYTGVDGVISGLSNAYFGIWGSFFNSVFTFGTWLRENKGTEYIIRETNPPVPTSAAATTTTANNVNNAMQR